MSSISLQSFKAKYLRYFKHVLRLIVQLEIQHKDPLIFVHKVRWKESTSTCNVNTWLNFTNNVGTCIVKI